MYGRLSVHDEPGIISPFYSLSFARRLTFRIHFWSRQMNITRRLKRTLIQRSLNKRKRLHPFDAEAAERYALSSDAPEAAINSYYFTCHDMNGTSLLLRFALRGECRSEVWFAYRDAAGNAWVSGPTAYGPEPPAGVQCIEPCKTWTFRYSGPVHSLFSGRECAAEFSGTFTAAEAPFEFGYHMDTSVLANAIAQQKWGRAFFDELQRNNQVHYEQQGHIKGELNIEGQTIRIDAPAMRDHSYGRREWGYMNRHVWLMALLKDGSSLNVNFVSYPALQLSTGYFTSPQGTVCVTGAALEETPAPGKVPGSLVCRMEFSDGTQRELSCKKEEEFVFPCGDAYTIFEGIGAFTVDGVPGRGVMEFGWNNDPSRVG